MPGCDFTLSNNSFTVFACVDEPTTRIVGDRAIIATGKNSFVVGADGYDDVSIRSHGRNDIVTYDDSNVTIGGEGKVNAQIGDSDTGGTVTMHTVDSTVRGGVSR